MLVDSTMAVYAAVSAHLLPTPARCHYTFNMRDLSRLFQGILMADVDRVKDVPALLGLWHHECCRVFGDRLVCDVDRSWLAGQLERRIAGDFGVPLLAAVPGQPHLYGDFAGPGGERSYRLMPDYQRVLRVMQEALEEYSASRPVPSPLVLFEAAVCHTCRLARVLRQPLGSALLLGVGGSGRQSLARLAAHLCEYECVQIELTKSYGVSEWRQDLQRVMLKAGVDNIHVAFLLTDTQITSESFLEDVNSLLNSGDVPGALGVEETDSVLSAMRPLVLHQGLVPSKSNLLATFARRVRCNLHIVLCMSPMGEAFRARLRRFPSLANCCTIDWFSEWPHSALAAVASSQLTETEAGLLAGDSQALVDACVRMHQSLSEASLRLRAQPDRGAGGSGVTPTAFLELLGTFRRLLALKSGDIRGARARMQGGLDKLLQTAQDVAGLQQELEAMKPQLLEAARETELTMEKITAEVALAEESRRSVSEEQHKASASAALAQEMADDAERDLAQALPALEAALGSLKELNKTDVTEVRAMQRPPPGVRLVLEAVCIMKAVKPRKAPPADKAGPRLHDYWEAARGLLQDPGRFIDGLLSYDKDNIPEAVIRQVQPLMDAEDFQPAAIARVSKACTSICLWVRAMYQYHHVAHAVLPKREARRVALQELAVSQAALSQAQLRLHEVEAGVARLRAGHTEATERRELLQARSDQCEGRLGRAAQLIGGLADERVRWSEAIKDLDCALTNIVGDVLLAAGFVTYLGPFTTEYRASLTGEWLAMMTDLGVAHSPNCSFVTLLGDQILIRSAHVPLHPTAFHSKSTLHS
ncbi:dynein axonemal heavy chain 1-like [Petromyzon marinus]|uniref:dynein axonemal heavy chain 1-like n=1 Tax=Petromyzon marinus TaxID=7757 RepID=UPI003F6F5320